MLPIERWPMPRAVFAEVLNLRIRPERKCRRRRQRRAPNNGRESPNKEKSRNTTWFEATFPEKRARENRERRPYSTVTGRIREFQPTGRCELEKRPQQ